MKAVMRSYRDGSRDNIQTSSDDGSSPCRLAFQRCHRLQARLEAVSAGLCELNMLRERQERLVKEAMCFPLSCVDGGEGKDEVEEGREEVGKEAAFVNPPEYEGELNNSPQFLGDLVERLETIGGENNTSDVSINSETSSRKSSGFFEGLDSDIFAPSRKNSVAEYSDICPYVTTSGEIRRIEEPVRRLSEYSLDGDVGGFARNRAESSSLLDHNAISRAKFARSISVEKVTTTENCKAKSSAGKKRSLSMQMARKLSYSGETGSKPTMGGSISSSRRPCLLQRSISVPESRNHVNSEPITREELIRRKRRSVHEIDFSLHGQPGLASQCYMGSSRAFRYPSPLHAISLQSPLCLPGPGYHEKQEEPLDEKEVAVDSTQAIISGTQGETTSGTTTREKRTLEISEKSFEVHDADNQAPTKAPSLVARDLKDGPSSQSRCNTKLISHSGSTMKETLLLSSNKNSVCIDKEKSENTTRQMSAEVEHKNQNGAKSSAGITNQKPRLRRKGVLDQDIKVPYNCMVTSYDCCTHPMGCTQKTSTSEKISSKDTNFKRNQTNCHLEKDARYKQTTTARQEHFQDTECLYRGRKNEYPSREIRHNAARSNFPAARSSHIDSSSYYNDGVVRSKTPVHQSLSHAFRRKYSGKTIKKSQRVVESSDDREQDALRSQPKRKNACVTPVQIWRVDYAV